ncbi:hypothetical protein DSO57_1025329 [Entomophthora muscae]|uniref:Uncharacterized protein n=1 Tax=Entomophthora muscae TaxID=34485 RepID=A0ACC2TPE0_9FUNG|nr:hypothetical protein DSO57_1025329 [Entomophthora muscae]
MATFRFSLLNSHFYIPTVNFATVAIPTTANLRASDLAIKALQHLKPNNLKLVPTQEQLVEFISNKCIAANPPPQRLLTSSLSSLSLMSLSSFLVGSASCFMMTSLQPRTV